LDAGAQPPASVTVSTPIVPSRTAEAPIGVTPWRLAFERSS
jgi:hypothetical protein